MFTFHDLAVTIHLYSHALSRWNSLARSRATVREHLPHGQSEPDLLFFAETLETKRVIRTGAESPHTCP
jgi:hypothetical protein